MRPLLVLAAAPLVAMPLLVAAPATATTASPRPQTRAALAPSALIPTTVSGFPGKAVTVAPGKTWSARVTVSGPRGRLVLLQRLSSGRWVTAKSVRTSSRRVAAFTVAQAKAGTFRYRVVVPRVGLFAARTTGIKVVTVKKVELRLVPSSVTGTFTGTQYLGAKGPGSQPFLTWSGNATFTVGTRSGASWNYRLTALSVTWSIDTSDSSCTYQGSGAFTLADATANGFEGRYSPWDSVVPREYSFDIVLKTGTPRFRYTVNCEFQSPYQQDFYTSVRAAELLRLGRVGVFPPGHSPLSGLPQSPDGLSFVGAIAAGNDSSAGDNTWNFTGENPLPFPKP